MRGRILYQQQEMLEIQKNTSVIETDESIKRMVIQLDQSILFSAVFSGCIPFLCSEGQEVLLLQNIVQGLIWSFVHSFISFIDH